MTMLKAKLLELERRKQQEKVDAITGEASAVDFGSQDRNYVLQPYQQVKDLRSGAGAVQPRRGARRRARRADGGVSAVDAVCASPTERRPTERAVGGCDSAGAARVVSRGVRHRFVT